MTKRAKKPVEVVLVGAGRRAYYHLGKFALSHPDDLRFIAVAEPDEDRRERFARAHGIPKDLRFRSWQDLAEREPLVPVLINATNDATHYASTMAAIEQGYRVLLEKPVATTATECASLARTADRTGADVWVCHELRNTVFFSRLREIVRSGRIGDVISIEHRENLAFWHMAHSYVRGNWSVSGRSGPMILTKCCHDFDVLTWVTGGSVARLSSFGSLKHYRLEEAPHPDLPERCTDGCPIEDDCPFYAPRIYIDGIAGRLPYAVDISDDPEHRPEALATGPYGRCVYRCDNDVVDHQTVNMELEGGESVTLTMQGHSHVEHRTMRYDGTRATLIGTFGADQSEITIYDHRSGEAEPVAVHTAGSHGGGDEKLLGSLVRAVREDATGELSTVQEALESHLLAFAAEESRVGRGAVVEMAEFRRRVVEEDSCPPGG